MHRTSTHARTHEALFPFDLRCGLNRSLVRDHRRRRVLFRPYHDYRHWLGLQTGLRNHHKHRIERTSHRFQREKTGISHLSTFFIGKLRSRAVVGKPGRTPDERESRRSVETPRRWLFTRKRLPLLLRSSPAPVIRPHSPFGAQPHRTWTPFHRRNPSASLHAARVLGWTNVRVAR
jgi:hypothetical protein